MDESTPSRSRRQLLAGGIVAAAAAILGRSAQPDATLAADGEPVLAGATTNATTRTTVRTTTDYAVVGYTDDVDAAGVLGMVGQGTVPPPDAIDAGVLGFGNGLGMRSVGVWGDTTESAGVLGTGPWGVYGAGGVGVAGDAPVGGTGVYGFVGTTVAPVPVANVAVEARAGSTNYTALNVIGKVRFNRSGKIKFVPGQTSLTVPLAGLTGSSLILATPATYQAGVYVAAAAPFTNQFVVRLSKAPTVNFYVQWMAIG